jgi:hypothetical protein
MRCASLLDDPPVRAGIRQDAGTGLAHALHAPVRIHERAVASRIRWRPAKNTVATNAARFRSETESCTITQLDIFPAPSSV